MTESDSNLLLGNYYTVNSKKTGKPYVDSKRRVYIFDNTMDARNFMDTNPEVVLNDGETIKQRQFVTAIYDMGAKYIAVKRGIADEFSVIEIELEDCLKNYYNPQASYSAIRFKQTSDLKYLHNFNNCTFLCPTYIERRHYQMFGKTNYACARTKSNQIFYLLFTSMAEFNKWNESQGNKFKPLEVDILKEERIRKGGSVLINPLSDKIIIKDERIKEIMRSGVQFLE